MPLMLPQRVSLGMRRGFAPRSSVPAAQDAGYSCRSVPVLMLLRVSHSRYGSRMTLQAPTVTLLRADDSSAHPDRGCCPAMIRTAWVS